jgi:Asp-tRNA(Asn)/Glu-tRNA(Gln) amidotransferase A subunit family amidase
MNSALARAPAWKIAAGIRDRQFSSLDVVDAHFRLIHQLDPVLHAFVSLDEERARQQAKTGG